VSPDARVVWPRSATPRQKRTTPPNRQPRVPPPFCHSRRATFVLGPRPLPDRTYPSRSGSKPQETRSRTHDWQSALCATLVPGQVMREQPIRVTIPHISVPVQHLDQRLDASADSDRTELDPRCALRYSESAASRDLSVLRSMPISSAERR